MKPIIVQLNGDVNTSIKGSKTDWGRLEYERNGIARQKTSIFKC